MALWVKNPPAMQETQGMQVQSLGWEDLLDKDVATHSSILAWKIPWMEEPGRLQSMESQRVDSLEKTLMPGGNWGQEEKGMAQDEMAGWHHQLNGREFEWTPGVGDGQGGLVCCSSWGCTEPLNWTEWIQRMSGGCKDLTRPTPIIYILR